MLKYIFSFYKAKLMFDFKHKICMRNRSAFIKRHDGFTNETSLIIKSPIPHNKISYITFLHELGHLIDMGEGDLEHSDFNESHGKVYNREITAWKYAWNMNEYVSKDEFLEYARYCLSTYLRSMVSDINCSCYLIRFELQYDELVDYVKENRS